MPWHIEISLERDVRGAGNALCTLTLLSWWHQQARGANQILNNVFWQTSVYKV